jgi:hypothetical protein
MRRVTLCALLLLSLAAPAAASAADELSATTRLDDRRFAAIGPRAYDIGTEAGRYPAMGFHTRGEMGGIWSPPIKLLDGVWFGVDGQWIGPAERFTSGWGYAKMDLPQTAGLRVQRTDFVPGNRRGVLIGLTFSSTGAARSFGLTMDAHSELMSIYPWGETTPYDQRTFNLPDQAAVDGRYLVFTEQGTPPAANAQPHDWAAAVGTSLTPASGTTGDAFRGPQGDVVCGPSGPNTPPIPDRCDDTAYGKGKGGELTYDVSVPAGGSTSVWFAVAGSESGAADAKALAGDMLANPARALAAKIAARERLAQYTRVNLPGDPGLAQAVSWSKQDLADSEQDVRDLELRHVAAGKAYPPVQGTLARAHFFGAGFPDYPWLFATDGEYTAFASVALGQFETMKDHLRALRAASLVINGNAGKVVHEVVTDGSVYFGALSDAGNTDETAKFPSAVALLWRWTGDQRFLDQMYPFTVRNLHYIDEQLDADGDGWPEGLGNVEVTGMGEEKLDNTVYFIRGLWDLADMAAAKGDQVTRAWATQRARDLTSRFERAWWYASAPGYADSLDDPGNVKLYQRHWIGVTPAEVELVRGGRTVPGLARPGHANAMLDVHETPCYGDASGMFHTGRPGCDGAPDQDKRLLDSFTLNTSIIAVGEGNYGRLGPDQQQRWTTALANQMIPGVEQPGAMPEIASPSSAGDILDRKFPERPQVQQAWGNYGTAWPVVHQQLGVRPDLGRGRLDVVPQPPGDQLVAARNIRLGDSGSVDVSATHQGRVYETVVTARVDARLRLGQTLPSGADVRSVRLNGRRVPWRARETNRGLELTVAGTTGRTQVLEVRAR